MTRVAGVVVLYRTPVNGTVLVESRNDSETIVSKTKRENRAQGKRSGWEKRDEKRVTLFSFQDSVGWDISSGKAESSGKGNASPIFRKTRVKLEDWRARARAISYLLIRVFRLLSSSEQKQIFRAIHVGSFCPRIPRKESNKRSIR